MERDPGVPLRHETSRQAGDGDAVEPRRLPGWCPAACPSPQQCSGMCFIPGALLPGPRLLRVTGLSPRFSSCQFLCPPRVALAGIRCLSWSVVPAEHGSLWSPAGSSFVGCSVEINVGRARCTVCTGLCTAGSDSPGLAPASQQLPRAGGHQTVTMPLGGRHRYLCTAPLTSLPCPILHSEVPHAGDLTWGQNRAHGPALSHGAPAGLRCPV